MKNISAYSLALCLGFTVHTASATTSEELGNIGSYVDSVLNPNMSVTANPAGTTYKTHQPPSVNQAGDALFYLSFSENVYKSSGAPRGWTREEVISNASTGYYAAVYTKGSSAVIAFRGSELGTDDWVTNGIMVEGEVPAQYQSAITDSADLVNRYSSYNIHFTGHSLGGGLATVAALRTGEDATVFDAAGVGDAVLGKIKDALAADGQARSAWRGNSEGLVNYNLEGEMVSDLDFQQDADTLGVDSKQYGDIFYLSADRFNPLPLADTGLTRHFTISIKEELQFLAQPIYRNNTSDYDSIDNDINSFRASFYIDWTEDTLQLLAWQVEYAINSFPSLLNEL
ncbi:DUF2974 domain-containing protein [Parasalinivibrio latis]|uniref:lipase family protein n=1 Tax=Parasalinivibrio latis TaxID=2952610 RepID=UPI0030E2B6CF